MQWRLLAILFLQLLVSFTVIGWLFNAASSYLVLAKGVQDDEYKSIGQCGCSKCTKTADLITAIIAELGIEGEVTKVSDPEIIMNYGVMVTPAVVVNDVVVHSGPIPHRDQVISWFE